jgi:hypothetical protein
MDLVSVAGGKPCALITWSRDKLRNLSNIIQGFSGFLPKIGT